MNAYVLVAIVGGVLGVIPILWRSKGSQMFLLLCAGSILSASVSETVTFEIRTVKDPGSWPLQSIVAISLLMLPPFLGLIISRGSVKKKRAPLHILPSLAAGILGYLWLIKLLPSDRYTIYAGAEVTKQLLRAADGALVAGILSSLALLWAERPKPDEDDKKKGKKKH